MRRTVSPLKVSHGRSTAMTIAVTELEIPVSDDVLHGNLDVPNAAVGVVIFAHGSGSSRLSPRNTRVARELRKHGLKHAALRSADRGRGA